MLTVTVSVSIFGVDFFFPAAGFDGVSISASEIAEFLPASATALGADSSTVLIVPRMLSSEGVFIVRPTAFR
jgi:hypothetical protein